jgi:hypothetical protein
MAAALHLLQQCPPPLPAGPGGARRIYREESLLLLALLRTWCALQLRQIVEKEVG